MLARGFALVRDRTGRPLRAAASVSVGMPSKSLTCARVFPISTLRISESVTSPRAARAAEVGLIRAAVPVEGLDQAVGEIVSKVLAGGPGALAAAKRLVFDVPGLDRTEAFVRTSELSARLFASDEAAEGMAAFREKRPASWVPDPKGNER